MQTQIAYPDESSIALAISFLKKEIPVAFPTETVYGLGAPVFSEPAIQKIFTIKGRPQDNPLIVHINETEEALLLAQDLPPAFFLLAERFWPGPLTLVVKRKGNVPASVSAGLLTIALRSPKHSTARSLIAAAGPLAAPSANLSGKPSPTTPLDVFEDLNGKIPLILAGECLVGIESTVVSLVGERPVILRPGTISKEMLEKELKTSVDRASADSTVMSPGMKHRHYAPKAKIRLVFDPKNLQGPYVLSPKQSPGMRLLHEKTLYAELRKADRCGVSEIEVDCSEIEHQTGLMDRLMRAANLISYLD